MYELLGATSIDMADDDFEIKSLDRFFQVLAGGAAGYSGGGSSAVQPVALYCD